MAGDVITVWPCPLLFSLLGCLSMILVENIKEKEDLYIQHISIETLKLLCTKLLSNYTLKEEHEDYTTPRIYRVNIPIALT